MASNGIRMNSREHQKASTESKQREIQTRSKSLTADPWWQGSEECCYQKLPLKYSWHAVHALGPVIEW